MEFGQRMKCCLSSAMATGAMFFASAAQATDWLVDQVNGNDGNLGAGVWTQAFATIQKAIDEASSGDSIFVAEGVYTPYEATPGDPLSTFVIDSGVKFYGGFPEGGADFLDRDPVAYETVLSGQLSSGNAYHVVTVTGATATNTRLEGFIIKDGNATGSSGSYHDIGGGLRVYADTSPSNVTNLLVVNCRFENNEATNGGAVALRIGHQANQVNVDFVNCEFYDNSSDGDGGAVWNCGGTVRLTNCVVARNNCDDDGAGVFLANPNARFFPGSVSRGDLLNCTITKNEAVSDGGGVFFDNNSQFIAKNSIFWGNKDTITQDGAATDEEAQISHGSSPNYDIDYCCIRLLSSFGGTGNISTNPMFIDASTDNYRLDVGSSCADKGSNADIPLDVADLDGDAISMEPTPYDLDRLTRRSKDGAISLICEPNFVDMGAYETHDCDGDGVPDAEETDGNADGVPDDCQDCNGNSIPDWVELAECAVSETGCKDCNGNGVLDECDIDMGCSADDNDDGRPDDCGCGLDIVIIVDNSGSMGGTNEPTPSGCENEFDNICNMVSGLSSTLQAANLPSLRITVLDISPTKESLPCADDNVVNLTGVYDEASNTCSGTIQDSAESWVSAVEIIVMNFDWNPGAKRIIVPISDEGPCHGDSPPICGTSDDDSVDAAIAAAIDNDCIVYSILGVTCQTAPNWLGCVPAYYEDIALSTGGAYFEVGGAGLQANYENIVGPDLASLLMDRIQSCLCAGDCVTSTTFAPPPDGEVNAADLAYLLGSWGSCPGCCSDTVSSATFTPPPRWGG